MKALSFWKAVTLDTSDLLERVLELLRERRINFCVIGGQAVNAYVEPLVSLDLDLAVAVDQIDQSIKSGSSSKRALSSKGSLTA